MLLFSIKYYIDIFWLTIKLVIDYWYIFVTFFAEESMHSRKTNKSGAFSCNLVWQLNAVLQLHRHRLQK